MYFALLFTVKKAHWFFFLLLLFCWLLAAPCSCRMSFSSVNRNNSFTPDSCTSHSFALLGNNRTLLGADRMTMDFCGSSLAELCKDPVPVGQNHWPTMTLHCATAVDGMKWECDVSFQ